MSEEDQSVDVAALPKFDMPSHESTMTAKDVKSLAIRHDIPLDLHHVALTEGWTMDKLPDDMIGLYEQYFEFSGIRVPFSAFLLVVIKHFRVHISQLVPLGLNRLTMFELYCRRLDIVPSVNLFRVFYKVSNQGHWFSFEKRVGKDAIAWRHHDSDVNDPAPEEGFSALDVQALTERVIDLRPVPFGLLFQGGLATAWDFPGFRPVFKDTEVNVITMSDYLRFPFLSGATIGKGNALTSRDQRVQHTVSPFPVGAHIDERESSKNQAYYAPEWSTRQRCRVDTLMWCRELMVHLAPPAAQEELSALTNATTLERAWFNLGRGAFAQIDVLERFENLQADYDQLAETHSKCGYKVKKHVHARSDLEHNANLYINMADRYKMVIKDQALRIKELEDELARNNFALVYAERINAERAQEKEKLVAQLIKTKMEKFNCICKLLPTVVSRLFQSHEYKQSLSKPFNLAIQAGWAKGLTEERSEEYRSELMSRMEGFDAYADKKMYVEYDKLFEKRYPFVEKISHGFRHTVSDLLKVYPDSPPSRQAPSKPSSRKAHSSSAPKGP
uniref:Transposase (putative) gypsy type domain-containing protein n=1 Tax=Tanacetum cinerariifolium TaxID=118510 RepID=A0A6L2NAA7_TANCI|nr:hypothetical protein [Tanacetum cinerariifolium]